MELFGKDLSRDCALVAEIGVNHEGDIDKACALIAQAAASGADAVKFQSFTPALCANASDTQRLQRLHTFALCDNDHLTLKQCADANNIAFFSSAVTHDKVEFLASLCPAIKIASGDIDFPPTVIAAAQTAKPVILSTGLATWEEIDAAVALFGEYGNRDQLILLQCTSGYPTPIKEAHVRVMQEIRTRYDVLVGYSNHVLGPYACYTAAALGACIIEVHVTDNACDRDFRDHALSFEPHELADLARGIRAVRAARGGKNKQRQASELGNFSTIRKGLIAAHDLVQGQVLSQEDITFARVTNGIAAKDSESVLGKSLRRAIASHMPILPKDIA